MKKFNRMIFAHFPTACLKTGWDFKKLKFVLKGINDDAIY